MNAPVVLVLILSVLPTSQQVKPDLKATVAALVEDLDSDQFATRKAAGRKLLQLGPAAIEFLDAPKSASVQVEQELRYIREQLRNQQAVSSLEPSTVTLSETLTVDQIADRITKQTGNKVSVAKLGSDLRGQRIEVRYQKQPFWHVIDDLSRQLKTTIELSDGAVRFVAGEPLRPDRISKSPAGMKAYRLRVGEVTSKVLLGGADQRLVRIPLYFGTEPRLRGIFLRAASNTIKVTASGNRSLPPYSANQSLEVPVSGRGEEVTWKHDVLAPIDPKTRSIDINGSVEVLMAAGYEPFRFRDLDRAKGTRRSRTGVDLRIDDTQIDKDRGDLKITLTVEWTRSIGAFDSYRTWQFHNEAWLKTADGKRIDFSGPLTTDGQANGGVRLTYHFKSVTADLSKCEFIYEAPTALRTVKVPFEFNSIGVGE